jgi:hypothetical protein
MLHDVPIVFAASLFRAAPLPAGAPASVQAVDTQRLARPLKRIAGPLPPLASASLDFVLRLYLRLYLYHVVRHMHVQDRIEGREPQDRGRLRALAGRRR